MTTSELIVVLGLVAPAACSPPSHAVDPADCYLYNSDEATCRAAGCNFFEAYAGRFCIDEQQQCIEDPHPVAVCGSRAGSDDFVANTIATAYYLPATGEVYELEDYGDLESPLYCRGAGASARVPGSPPACDCIADDSTVEGKCPGQR